MMVLCARLLPVCLLGLELLCHSALAQPVPQRIVSANLCADQMVLALADPSQIASLSPFARGPELSFLYAKAGDYPANRGTAEDIIQLEADLVLIGAYDSRFTRALLEAKGVAFMVVEPWGSLGEGRDQIRTLAARFGHKERGEALIAQIDAALTRLQMIRGTGQSALVLERRGYVPGRGLLAELLVQAGFADAGATMGLGPFSFVRLESVLASPPDVMVGSAPVAGRTLQGPEDQGEAWLFHPALMALYPPHKRLLLEDRLSICGGPSTPELIEQLATAIEQRRR